MASSQGVVVCFDQILKLQFLPILYVNMPIILGSLKIDRKLCTIGSLGET